MLIVDTGPLVAYLNRNDPDHDRCAVLLESRTDDLLVTPYVVTEACYPVGKHVGAAAEINLVEALLAGDLNQIDIAPVDLNRMAELMRQYPRVSAETSPAICAHSASDSFLSSGAARIGQCHTGPSSPRSRTRRAAVAVIR